MRSPDPREAELIAEVERLRAALLAQGQALRRTLVLTLDPRERVRRQPLQAILTSLATGILLGLLPRGWFGGSRDGSGAGSPRSSLPPVLAGLLPDLLPMLLRPVLASLVRDEQKPLP
jgi:hypothetical protein